MTFDFTKFFLGILGGIGIIRHDLKFKKSQFKDFARDLPAGSIILTRDRTPGFFGGGIDAVTGSPWQHTAFYIGKSTGEMIKAKYPELTKPRKLLFQQKLYPLPDLPAETNLHEIIESSSTVIADTLDKYNSDDTQMEAWIRPLTTQQIEQLVFRAYLMHGMPYDVSEIGSYVLPIVNPNEKNHFLEIHTEKSKYQVPLVCCSTLVSWIYRPVELIKTKKYPVEQIPPGEIGKYCRWAGWQSRKFNF